MLFQQGNFISAAGLSLDWKVECDALLPADWATLASIVHSQIRFSEVLGVPTGGLLFANALKPYCSVGPLLIVDDVLTTGKSMEALRDGRDAIGVVVFCRGESCPAWITPMWKWNFRG